MSVALSDTRPLASTTARLTLLVMSIVLGFFGGLFWSSTLSLFVYDGVVGIFTSPGFQITSLTMGIGLAFLLGFVHVTSICYLPAVTAALPMVQMVRTPRDWLKTVAVMVLSMVIVA